MRQSLRPHGRARLAAYQKPPTRFISAPRRDSGTFGMSRVTAGFFDKLEN